MKKRAYSFTMFLLAILCSLVVVVLASSVAPSTQAGDSAFLVTTDRVISLHSQKCLSLSPIGGFNENEPVQQWNCGHYHMGWQATWLLDPTDELDVYYLRSVHSGKCLTRTGENNGSVVVQAQCYTQQNPTTQAWTVKPMGSYSRISSTQSGQCLDVSLTDGGKKDGGIVHLWSCHEGNNQRWVLNPVTAPNPPHDSGTGELCDACNPANPKCSSGGKCIVLPGGQSICGSDCSYQQCPTGYQCRVIGSRAQGVKQCVPIDFSCPLN